MADGGEARVGSVVEAFVCRPLSISLTRSSCAARHRLVQIKGSTGGPKLLSTACIECPVGAAHAAGMRPSEWPDGPPIELRTLTAASDAAAMPTPAARPRRGWQPPTPQPSPKKEKTLMPQKPAEHTWNGKTQSIKAWAAEFGITDSGMRLRLKKGLNPDGTGAASKPSRGGNPKRSSGRRERPERIEVRELARVDVPGLLKALGLDVRMMEGELEGWQVGACRAALP